MPRLARLDAPGILHHVIIRGIERQNIFSDNKDRDNLLTRLSELLPETKTSCYAWAFLSNHTHFLFRTGIEGLSKLMHRLLTGYVVSFNRRHLRHGPLFQNRFKSIICQEDVYLMELVRYIHLNPLRAGIVSDISHLNHYKYCGHSILMGKRKGGWMDSEFVLSYFGKTRKTARDAYDSYIREGIELGRRPELVSGGLIRSLGGWKAVRESRLGGGERIKGDQRILGDGAFALEVLKEAEETVERQYEMKRLGYDLSKVEARVSEIFAIDKEDLYSRSQRKDKANARALFCYWAVEELGYTQNELAKRLGMTQPGVGYAVHRGKTISKSKHYTLTD